MTACPSVVRTDYFRLLRPRRFSTMCALEGCQRSDSIPSEAIADPVDGMVGRPTAMPLLAPGGALHL
jgi:hypothetical protein